MVKTERNNEIINLVLSGKSFVEVGKLFNVSKQRVLQIYSKRYPEKYSLKTSSIYITKLPDGRILKNENFIEAQDLKIWSKRKREHLGIPDGEVQIKTGGLDFIRELVRMRDNHTCQQCLKKWEVGKRRFDVHHIDPEMEGKGKYKGVIKMDKSNFDKMITYCHKCHFSQHTVRSRISNGIKKLSPTKQQNIVDSSDTPDTIK